MDQVRCKQFLIVAIVLFLAWTTPAHAQQPLTVTTAKDAEGFIQTYYQGPRPQMVGTLIGVLHATAVLHTPNAIPPYIGFFSEVFAGKPDRLPEWQALIAKQAHPTKGILEWALSVSKDGGVIAIDGHSAALNDMYWGAFFASGDAKYVNKLIDQLRFIDEREQFELFGVGAASKWSLASNARSHTKVRTILDSAKQNADRRTQEIIVELLQTDPVRIRQEINETARLRWGGGRSR